MDRISGADYATATVSGVSVRQFQDPNLGLDQLGTDLVAIWHTGVQESIVRTIEAAGLVPADAAPGVADTQLLQAIRIIGDGHATALTATASLTAAEAGIVLVSAAGGNVALTLPAAASAGGQPFGFKIIRTDTSANSVTIGLAGGDTSLLFAAPVSMIGGSVVELCGDGISKWIRTSGPQNYPINLASPPGTPVLLSVGDSATVTFSAVSTIPLHIASAPGFYSVKVATAATNTTDADWFLQPNDATFAAAFAAWNLENADTQLTAFGSATTAATFVGITAAGAKFGDLPRSSAMLTQNSFLFDMFNGPTGGDAVNGIGPSMLELLISTATIAKMVKYSSGTAGGPSSGFAVWNDTTTAWTSLGTLIDSGASSMTGTALVTRLG